MHVFLGVINGTLLVKLSSYEESIKSVLLASESL